MVALYKKAISGDVKSLRAISEQYRNGTNGFPRNARQAANALAMAAGAGDTQSQLDLAKCYEEGHGRPADDAKAMAWYYRAGQQGSKVGKRKYEQIGKQLAAEEAAREREAQIANDNAIVDAFIRSQQTNDSLLAQDAILTAKRQNREYLLYNACRSRANLNEGILYFYYVGVMTYEGYGCPMNRALGLQYIRQAAALGEPNARAWLRKKY